jgi:dihydroorotate dehydrogenase
MHARFLGAVARRASTTASASSSPALAPRHSGVVGKAVKYAIVGPSTGHACDGVDADDMPHRQRPLSLGSFGTVLHCLLAPPPTSSRPHLPPIHTPSNFPQTGTAVSAVAYHATVQDVRSSPAYVSLVDHVLVPLLRLVDPEQAHNISIRAASFGLTPIDPDVDSETRAARLSTTVLGITFRNPVGLAAGFDKQAEAMDGLAAAGFGFVEIGTVTPKPQPGNPRPRMFRLPEDKAVINRFGFNSDGLETVLERLAYFWTSKVGRGWAPGESTSPVRPILGVNIGKNKEGEAVADYTAGMTALSPLADYVTVNISSPNTPGLRALQGREQLRSLLQAVKNARDKLPWGKAAPDVATVTGGAEGGKAVAAIVRSSVLASRRRPPPILVKIAPDLTEADMADIAAVVLETGIDGIIVSNTTIARPATLKAPADVVAQTGGLSGAPVREPSLAVLRRMYELTGGKVTLVGVGGISSAEDAYAKIRAGASLVQLYTALAYEGEDRERRAWSAHRWMVRVLDMGLRSAVCFGSDPSPPSSTYFHSHLSSLLSQALPSLPASTRTLWAC